MKERNVGYDLIRIIAIFLVVAIHGNVVYLSGKQGTAGWYIVMLFNSMCLVSVPLFFMVSGALLLDTNEIISLNGINLPSGADFQCFLIDKRRFIILFFILSPQL